MSSFILWPLWYVCLKKSDCGRAFKLASVFVSFPINPQNEEEEQLVAVMNTSRLNTARTNFRWSHNSPLARARARANGSTSSGLPTSHPLLMRNSDVSTTTNAADNNSVANTAAGFYIIYKDW